MYRSDIDGLRAVAILPVLFFHAGYDVFRGGYIGVDIFFVISGYLITKLLIDDIESGHFSFRTFYVRRCRRLLPALFFMIICCIPFAWFWMLPSQLMDFGQSILSTLSFSSNILFWMESGYFSPSSEEKPLLHTWSLAVEEQFYLFFPIFLFMLWRTGRPWIICLLLVISIISLFLAEWGSRNYPSAAFYLLPTRAWELLFGAVAAFITLNLTLLTRNIISFLGLASIILTIFLFDDGAIHPGMSTLIPVVGTLLIIICGSRENLVSRLLGNRVLVGIGLISYSLYLWHQPILALNRLRMTNEYQELPVSFLIFVIFIVAYLSWKYIEQPFRKKRLVSMKRVSSFALLSSSCLLVVGLLITRADGFPERLSFSDPKLKPIFKEWSFKPNYPSHDLITDSDYGYKMISFNASAERNIVLIGDSHSYQYWAAIAKYVEQNAGKFQNTNIFFKNVDLNDLRFDSFKLPDFTTDIVLSYFWSLRLNNPNVNTYIRCCGNGPGGVVGRVYSQLDESKLNTLYDQLRSFVTGAEDSGKAVTIILDNPFGEELNPKSLLTHSFDFGITFQENEKTFIELSRADAEIRREPTHNRMRNMLYGANVNFIDPFQYLCTETICPKFSNEGFMMYKDYDHISYEASVENFSYLDDFFKFK